MRHIKPFNESITDKFLSDLRDFCEMNLVYLMNDGFDVSVVKHDPRLSDTYLGVTLEYPFTSNFEKSWIDISDVIISFFTRLNNQYNIITFDQLGGNKDDQVQFRLIRKKPQSPFSNQIKSVSYTVSELINDETLFKQLGDVFILEIRFYISGVVKDDVSGSTLGSRIRRFLRF